MHATTWIKLKNITLNVRSQKQENYKEYDSIYIKCSGMANLYNQNQISGCLRLGERVGLTVNGHKETFWIMEMF